MAYDTARNRLVVFGGSTSGGSNGEVLGDTWEWDGARWLTFKLSASPPAGGYLMAYDSVRRRAVLFGGSQSETWEWDGASWQKKAPALSPPSFTGKTMAYDQRHALTVLFSSDKVSETWAWDGVDWRKLAPAASPSPRYNAAMAYDSIRQRIVLFGGYLFVDATHYGSLSDTWEWDGATWTQCAPTSSPLARHGHAMTYDPLRGHIVLFGGESWSIGSMKYHLQDLWEWDGSNWIQSSPLVSPPGRQYSALEFDQVSGKVLLFGGQALSRTVHDLWSWDGSVWDPLADAPEPLYDAAMAYDAARDRMVLFGGDHKYAAITDMTWEWDGGRWSRRAPAASPPPRRAHAMAYDSELQRVILFGGYYTNYVVVPWTIYNDIWEWNGLNWKRCTPAVSPEPRWDHAMAYDRFRKRLVLFGGLQNVSGSHTPMNDTWEWDGERWVKRSPALSPPARSGHGLAYDSARNRIVLFGGYDRSSGLNDTWEWDGSSWLQRAPAVKPPVRRDYMMTYDAARRRVLLYSGLETYSWSPPTHNVWAWDGANWAKLNPATVPPRAPDCAIAYDDRRGRVMVMGGLDNGTWYDDAWAWSGPAILTSPDSLAIDENTTAALQVWLSHPPTTSTLVSVARVSGDMDISVDEASKELTFTPQDWNAPKTVQLFAARDRDALSGNALIRFSAVGFPDQALTATEVEGPISAVPCWALYE